MPTREPAAWRQSSSFNKVAVFFDLDNEKSAQPKGVKSFRPFFFARRLPQDAARRSHKQGRRFGGALGEFDNNVGDLGRRNSSQLINRDQTINICSISSARRSSCICTLISLDKALVFRCITRLVIPAFLRSGVVTSSAAIRFFAKNTVTFLVNPPLYAVILPFLIAKGYLYMV